VQPGTSVGVDIGGTFTDILWRGADGVLRVEKRLSTPRDYSRAILEGLADLSNDDLGVIGLLSHATTVATNAVLEGTGARIGLIATEGFRDVLEFGRLQRSELYALDWEKPAPLVPRRLRVEVRERVLADGSLLVPLDLDSVESAVDTLLEEDVEAIAVCLLNSYANPAHEKAIGEAIRARPHELPIVLSSDLLREASEFERASTAVVNAYLMPVMAAYLRLLSRRLTERGCKVRPSIMQSSGGTIGIEAAPSMPVRMVESGPAAGVIAAAAIARQYDIERAISFDMGGTTAKACLIEHFEPYLSDEYWVGAGLNREGGRLLRGNGYPIRVPTMDIAEVSSGGGSIAWLDAGGALKVGPLSAGANPGPACYGLGGTEPTFTDACVVLGILGRETIGAEHLRLEPALATDAIRRALADPLGITVEEAARGIYEVAISKLMRAIRAVTTDVGKEPRDFALIAFGGGGGMVAGPLARELGIEQVVIPRLPGVFSALGLLAAPARRDAAQAAFLPLTPASMRQAGEIAERLGRQLATELRSEGYAAGELVLRRRLDMHYRGQASSLSIEWPAEYWADPEGGATALAQLFSDEYLRLHGHLRGESELETVSVRVSAAAALGTLGYRDIVSLLPPADAADCLTRRIIDLSTGSETEALVATTRVQAAAITDEQDLVIDEPDATLFVPSSFRMEIDEIGTAVLRPRLQRQRAGVRPSGVVTPASLEIFQNWLGALNDELTGTIARTAQSEIAKDTLDFATAICDRQGRVVSQGLTMVLHAGSIPAAIDLILSEFGDDLRSGDAFLSNDPYLAGGSHLPDIYVIRPMFTDGRHIGFVGTVCHTADMGGRVPGGNAADSTEIYQEGLRLPPIRLLQGDVPSHAIEAILRANVRVPDKVLGDLYSLVNACRVAERKMDELARQRGAEDVLAHMDGLLEHATRLFRDRIRAFPIGRFEFSDVLDDDGVGNGPIKIHVSIERDGDSLVIDFAGSDPQVPGATNSPLCFTQSAAYYATKAVLGWDIPDNSGYFRLVDVRAPRGTVVNPVEPGATGAKGVAAFRITDTLFGAFATALPGKVPAAGDGGATIVTFGGRESDIPFVLVDVVMSAWGGRADHDGVDGISSAASNGRNTPVEVIEAAYPVRVRRYELIPDSGGAGRFRGGLATRRVFEYIGARPAVLQVRTDRNPTRPWGLAKGGQGSNSSNVLLQPDGTETQLATKFTRTIEPGAVFEHQTASGGGYGDPFGREPEAVLHDVLEGKVTCCAAEQDYGVVITGDMTIDIKATARRRVGEAAAAAEPAR
jgi:N-methylhydantoinase A/oxoprolinase/acetone carboxylase beta subunit/N-methylhydantoinase B/oxoprolinase/acetone carboxylase alpha subunit